VTPGTRGRAGWPFASPRAFLERGVFFNDGYVGIPTSKEIGLLVKRIESLPIVPASRLTRLPAHNAQSRLH